MGSYHFRYMFSLFALRNFDKFIPIPRFLITTIPVFPGVSENRVSRMIRTIFFSIFSRLVIQFETTLISALVLAIFIYKTYLDLQCLFLSLLLPLLFFLLLIIIYIIDLYFLFFLLFSFDTFLGLGHCIGFEEFSSFYY